MRRLARQLRFGLALLVARLVLMAPGALWAQSDLERAYKKEFTYLEYGSYLSAWKQRLRLKMWSGWPTLPMVFVNGTLVGGASELAKLIESGELDELLAA